MRATRTRSRDQVRRPAGLSSLLTNQGPRPAGKEGAGTAPGQVQVHTAGPTLGLPRPRPGQRPASPKSGGPPQATLRDNGPPPTLPQFVVWPHPSLWDPPWPHPYLWSRPYPRPRTLPAPPFTAPPHPAPRPRPETSPPKDPSSSPPQISVTPPSLFAPSNPRPRDANWLLSLELSGLRLVIPVAVPPFDWSAAPAFAVPCTLVGAGLAAAGGAGLVGRTEGVDPRSALRLGWSARSTYRRLSRLSRFSLLRLGYFRLRRRRRDLPVPTPDPPRPPTGRPGHGLW